MKKTLRVIAAALAMVATVVVTSTTASAAPKEVHYGSCLFPLHGDEPNGEVVDTRSAEVGRYLKTDGVKEVRYQSNGKIVTKLQCTSTIEDLYYQLVGRDTASERISPEALAYLACGVVHFQGVYYPTSSDGIGSDYGDLVRYELKVRENGRVDLVCRWHALRSK